MSNAMQSTMAGLWFQERIAAAGWQSFNVAMDQATLADSVFNPADALRLLVTDADGDCMDGGTAATVCEVPRSAFYADNIPAMGLADWERALARMALCMLASWRNEWRRERGYMDEVEDVTTAPDRFFDVVASGFRQRAN